ncbi:bifunctional 2-polyprenyl-6-hydroxyphenol methylase/3-demethylubiquinol 3-O-methyltransferase UbiG [Plantactinospora sp. KBS50]|uniref:class I SAM-dependent methyltransferase n=1 Tax=Plantactinospora sp. KBS50 TaxID=2024580 RepID=UPI000BAAB4EB|nr:class I SAM-dependent methyltransferase [Plantactinospora sp. KBS50]ASW54801.1 hypothetical protein CIK06_12340 [Plantactinospora sp. KBS50]
MSSGTLSTTCLSCGSDLPHRAELDGVVHRCDRCGFGWTVSDPDTAPVRYESEYFTGGGYEDYFQPAPRRFEAARRLRWLSGLVRPSTLVEAGCAGGYFLEAARDAGFAVTGVELSRTAANFATERLGVPVLQGRFEQVAATLRADVVCAFHVLEHVDDPRLLLQTARQVLAPGGWLALEVPNIASVAAQRFGRQWPGLQPEYHRWHFTPESLTKLLVGSGFDVVRRDTAVFRYYMPLRYRLRHARQVLPPDLISMRSPRLTHPWRADLLRVIARRPTSGRSDR